MRFSYWTLFIASGLVAFGFPWGNLSYSQVETKDLAPPSNGSLKNRKPKARATTVRWHPVRNAQVYEFELSKSPKMLQVGLKRRLQETKIKLRLQPGTYYFRVRGLDLNNVPGPWTGVQGFQIYAGPPEPLLPSNKQVFKEKSDLTSEGRIRFEWDRGKAGEMTLIEIADKQGVVLTRGFKKVLSYDWRPVDSGIYRWRVGYPTQSGQEWSNYHYFQILPQVVAPEVIVKEVYLQDIEGQDEDVAGEEKWLGRHDDWGYGVIARYAQALNLITVSEKDYSFDTSGSALVGSASGEFRLRAPRQAGNRWRLSGSANLEVLRQSIVDETFTLPQLFFRGFATYRINKWRYGPLVQLGLTSSAILVRRPSDSPVVDGEGDQTTERNVKIARKSIGLGGALVYEASEKLYFSAILLLRRDFGGTATANQDENKLLPNDVQSSTGYEAGVGTVFSFSEKWMLETRIRSLSESLNWTASDSNLGASTFENTFLIIDFGLGYNF